MKYILTTTIATAALLGSGMVAYADSPYKDTSSSESRSSYAAYTNSSYDDFTGIYVGGNAGYAFTDDLKGWNGGAFVGYGFVHEFDLFGAYAGAEIGYEWGGGDGTVGGLAYEKDNAWSVTLRPGAKIMEDSLGYGIIGYSRAEFEAGGTEEDLDGLILGLGAQFNTNTAFKPRLEYTWTNYEDGNIGGTSYDANESAIKVGAVFQF